MMGDKNPESPAEKFGLPPGAGMVLMFALVDMPLAQQTAEEDASDKGGSKD